MLLGGLWHGAGWTSLIWGMLHGTFLAINHLWRSWLAQKGWEITTHHVAYVVFAFLLTQFVVVAWVFFWADTLNHAARILESMLGVSAYVAADKKVLVNQFDIAFIKGMFARYTVGLITYQNPRTWSVADIKWSPSVR